MTAVFETWYDDRKPEERQQARSRVEDARDWLARIGIGAEIEDDPPYVDEEGTYLLGPSGRFWVKVPDADVVRSRELLEGCEAG
ncbi:MAG TPA: hypothetical protein VKE74_36440 [Gemmataceae bacterium]|nr:hypothetical protein [Gemmataceae bacterium]